MVFYSVHFLCFIRLSQFPSPALPLYTFSLSLSISPVATSLIKLSLFKASNHIQSLPLCSLMYGFPFVLSYVCFVGFYISFVILLKSLVFTQVPGVVCISESFNNLTPHLFHFYQITCCKCKPFFFLFCFFPNFAKATVTNLFFFSPAFMQTRE